MPFAYDGGRIIDATAYADMQELLVAADLLITDYSSSMFDYALQQRIWNNTGRIGISILNWMDCLFPWPRAMRN